jgi:hypothetical protein
MINSINELQTLIKWCKDEKVKSLKVGDISFEISDLGLVESLTSIEDAVINEDKKTVFQKDLIDSDVSSKEEQDEDLFWSSRS